MNFRSPATREASGSRMTASSMYSLPGPWHFSHWTPSSSRKPASRSHFSVSAAVAWQPRQIGAFCGSSGMPLRRAICRASGVASEAHAFEWALRSHRLYWLPAALPSWHCAHARAPT